MPKKGKKKTSAEHRPNDIMLVIDSSENVLFNGTRAELETKIQATDTLEFDEDTNYEVYEYCGELLFQKVMKGELTYNID